MSARHPLPFLLFFAIIGTSCTSAFTLPPEQRARTEHGVTFENGGVIVSGNALTDGRGTLLNTLHGKVPNFRVQRHGQCPEITLRSTATQNGFVNPSVYVDGTHATDTCILETLRAEDVERVEVYPMGFTRRPGYGRHSHGLILVFLRGA